MEVKEYLSCSSSHKQPFLLSFSMYSNSRLTAAIVSLHCVWDQPPQCQKEGQGRALCSLLKQHSLPPSYFLKKYNYESQVRISPKEQEPCAVPSPAPPCLCILCSGWGRSRLVCQQAQMRKWVGDGSCNESHLLTQKLMKFPIRIIYHGKLFVQGILCKISYFYVDKL